MKKYYILLGIFIAVLEFSHAQQGPQYTQYMFNNFVINPAVAGTYDFYQANTNFRIQWAGFTDSPRTYNLSVYGPSKTKDMGFGGQLYTDATGPTSRMGMSGAWAYNIAINEVLRLSGGVNFGFIQYKVDGSRLIFDNEDDPLANGKISNAFVPDASLGLYLYSSNLYVGFSAHQLLGNKLSVFDEKIGINKLKQHYYLTAGYQVFLNKDFQLDPSILIKGVSPSPMQFELNVKTTYQRIMWFGLSYRSSDAIAILLGYIHNNKISFGYSYDATLTNIRQYSSGSHEILIGIKFNVINN